MKRITLKALGLFMTVFAVSQFGHTDKPHASTMEMSAQKNLPLATATHGGGCCCASCALPSEALTPNRPA